MKKWLIGFGFVMGAVGIALLLFFYAVKIEPYRLKMVEYRLTPQGLLDESSDVQKDSAQENLKQGILGQKDTIKMIQISDIQISEEYTEKELKKIVDQVNDAEPDLIFFTGDLYENYAEYGPEKSISDLLSEMEAKLGKYAVWGNRDYGGGCARRYESIMEESGFTLLTNDTVQVETESGNSIFIGGLDDELLGEPDIEKLRSGVKPDKSDYRILLVHEPDPTDQYAEDGFDLILAGHSHGGQVRLPFLKGITTSLAENYIRGFYTLGRNTMLYVNSGIGTSHYQVRFGVVPEITVFTLDLSTEGKES